MIGPGIRRRLRSVVGWLRRSTPTSLDSVTAAPTIGDVVDHEAVERRLPEGWRVGREIVQFRGEPLAEVLRLTDREGFRITLKPVAMLEPTGPVELYTLASPVDARQRRETADSLAAALDSAVEIAVARRTHRSADRSAWGPSTDR